MHRYACECVESVIRGIRQARDWTASAATREHKVTDLEAYARTLASDTDIQCDQIMQVANALYLAYSIGRLDGIREMMGTGSSHT